MGAIEALLIGALLGWFGHSQIIEPVCKTGPLVEASCPTLTPPTDASFGATTYSLTTTVGQYRECRAACLGGAK